MPRKPLIRSNVLPYHVFNRVNNREAYPLPIALVWDIFWREITTLNFEREAQVHSFVLMSNHFHMGISTPGDDLGVVMQHLSRSVTQTFNTVSGRSGHLFGGRYKGSLITNPAHFANVTKYIYRNPVKAKITEKVEDYPYSTLYGLQGSSHLPMPLYRPHESVDDALMPQNSTNLLAWLNTPFRNEDYELLRKGLKRGEFKTPRVGTMKKRSPIDSGLV